MPESRWTAWTLLGKPQVHQERQAENKPCRLPLTIQVMGGSPWPPPARSQGLGFLPLRSPLSRLSSPSSSPRSALNPLCCAQSPSRVRLRSPMDWRGPPGALSLVILQARWLEWVACLFSGGSPHPRTKPRSPTLQADSLPTGPPGSPLPVWLTGTCHLDLSSLQHPQTSSSPLHRPPIGQLFPAQDWCLLSRLCTSWWQEPSLFPINTSMYLSYRCLWLWLLVCLYQHWETLSIKGRIVNISGFEVQTVSITLPS